MQTVSPSIFSLSLGSHVACCMSGTMSVMKVVLIINTKEENELIFVNSIVIDRFRVNVSKNYF